MTKELENLLNSIKEWALENPQKRTIVCAVHDSETNDGTAIMISGTRINVATAFAMMPMNNEELCDMLPAIYKVTKKQDSDNKQLEDEKPPMKDIIIPYVNKKKIIS